MSHQKLYVQKQFCNLLLLFISLPRLEPSAELDSVYLHCLNYLAASASKTTIQRKSPTNLNKLRGIEFVENQFLILKWF